MGALFGFIGLGHWEILIVAGVVLLLFGNRLPSVMRSMGRGIVEFKKGVQGIEDKTEEAAHQSVSGDAAQTVAEDTVHAAPVEGKQE